MLLESIRQLALRIKEDTEDAIYVPRKLRCDLHHFGKWLYCATYGLTPQQARDCLFEGVETDVVNIIHANRCLKHYGVTLLPEGGRNCSMHVSEPALFSMIAYGEMKNDWRRKVFAA